MNCFRTLFRATNIVAASRYLSMSSCARRSTRRISLLSSHLLNNSSTNTRRFLSNTGGSNEKIDKGIGIPVDIEPSERTESLPNESWTQETLDVYHKLQNLVDTSNGAWVKHYTRKKLDTHERFFMSCVLEDGKLFELCVIYNKSERILKAVCQFGPYTKGLNRFVNGGAMAVVLDCMTTLLPQVTGNPSLTANLSVNFQKPLLIESTAAVECRITSIEGKKVFVEGEMTSPDGSQIYCTVKTLCIRVA